MIVNAGYRGKVGASVPKFTYTGTYNVREDGVVELLTSGTLVFLSPSVIDVFCVGGGGAGCTYKSSDGQNKGYGGGGGGHTATLRAATVNGSYEITIGNGGTISRSQDVPGAPTGEDTVFGAILTAAGGTGRSYTISESVRLKGCSGGSGGGGGVASNSDYGSGGSDGEDGEQGYGANNTGGEGQGSTTREFGEPNGKLYAGGGGGGRYMISSTPIISLGGSGGGGAGAWSAGSQGNQAAGAGGANTGGGGGGGVRSSTSGASQHGASGGSGICCFRVAK